MMWYHYKQVIQNIFNKIEFVSEASKDSAQVFLAVFAAELFKINTNLSYVVWSLLLVAIFWFIGIISYKNKYGS